MEISQASIEKATFETTTKLTDDLFRLIQVREKNKEMAKDWLLFLKTSPKFYRLRPGEIYQAFKMALSRELLDSKNEEINVLPELSINTTGKILNSYIEWKKKNDEYQLAKTKLKMAASDLGPTEEEKKKNYEDFLMMVFEDIHTKRVSNDAWQLFEKLGDKVKLEVPIAKRLYRMQNAKYLKELQTEVISNGRRPHHVQLLERCQKNSADGKPNTIVQNNCRSIVVSHYLRQFKTFERFQKQIEG